MARRKKCVSVKWIKYSNYIKGWKCLNCDTEKDLVKLRTNRHRYKKQVKHNDYWEAPASYTRTETSDGREIINLECPICRARYKLVNDTESYISRYDFEYHKLEDYNEYKPSEQRRNDIEWYKVMLEYIEEKIGYYTLQDNRYQIGKYRKERFRVQEILKKKNNKK